MSVSRVSLKCNENPERFCKEGRGEDSFTSGDHMPSRQKLCRAQLSRPGEQSRIDAHLKERQWRSCESVGVQRMRAIL